MDGVAVIEFDEDVRDVLESASETSGIDRTIVPNYLFEIADYVYPGEHPENESAEIEAVSPDDVLYPQQWHHQKINSEGAWKVTLGKSVSVAVIDNGFDDDHEDLINNIKKVYNASDGGDDVSPVSDLKTNSHGTHVAGIIAAEINNEKGGCGVAPEADLYLIKVADSDGVMPISNLVRAINKAASWKVDVVNMSLGSSAPRLNNIKILQEAIDALSHGYI